jgi:hypothetical protein
VAKGEAERERGERKEGGVGVTGFVAPAPTRRTGEIHRRHPQQGRSGEGRGRAGERGEERGGSRGHRFCGTTAGRRRRRRLEVAMATDELDWLRLMNECLLVKWIWRIAQSTDISVALDAVVKY